MKSRTILKYQYDEIGTFLCDKYVEKNHLLLFIYFINIYV